MKKVKFLITLPCLLILMLALLTSCTLPTLDTSEKEEPELTTEYVYSLAKNAGYTGTLEEFILDFKGERGADGEDGVGIMGAAITTDGSLLLTLTNGTSIDCGKINVTMESSTTISIGENGNWYIDGEDTGKRAEAQNANTWHTGEGFPAYSLGVDGDLYLNTKTSDVYKKVAGLWTVIANIAGDGVTVNEGDEYNVTINNGSENDKFAASKALMSAVKVTAAFPTGLLQMYYSNGSGVIYQLDKASGDAFIITNYHVVYDVDATSKNKISTDIGIYLYGMEYNEYKISAEYIGGSMTYDIAVLKVTDNEILKNSAAEAVEVADSRDVRVLDTAIAIGNPASLGISATKGSVSVESQYIEMTAPDEQTLMEYRVMRIDTPVNSGNSGGGLFDSKGRLIGIVSAKESETGIENMGYAIPSNLAVYVADNIIRNCDGVANEQVIKCRLGIMITLSESKAVYNEETGELIIEQTSVISEIETGSVAETMLMVGDQIKSFEIDGTTYEVRYNYDGGEILLNADVSSVIYVNVERAGEAHRIRLYTTEDNFVKVS